MSSIYSLPIKITSSSPISGQTEKLVVYPVIPLTVTDNMFTVVIVGYKSKDSIKTVVATKIINENEVDRLDFINENNGIDGYFIIYEPNPQKQQQIQNNLPIEYQLPI